MELPEEVKSVFSEIIVTPDMLIQGDHLIDIPLPDNTLVVLVKRFNHFFVPNGCSQLFPNDKLLIISDNEKELKQGYNTLGIEEFTITKNYTGNSISQKPVVQYILQFLVFASRKQLRR